MDLDYDGQYPPQESDDSQVSNSNEQILSQTLDSESLRQIMSNGISTKNLEKSTISIAQYGNPVLIIENNVMTCMALATQF